MNCECVEYDKSASHQFDDGTSDMDGMDNSMVCGIDTDTTNSVYNRLRQVHRRHEHWRASFSYTSYETYADGNWSVKVAATDGLPESENGYVDADGDSEYDIVNNKYAYTDKWQFPMATVNNNLGAFLYDQYICRAKRRTVITLSCSRQPCSVITIC